MSQDEYAHAVAVSANGRFAAVGSKRPEDRTFAVWDIERGTIVLEKECDDPLTALALTPDGDVVVAKTREVCVAWETPSGEEIYRSTVSDFWLQALPQGGLLAVGACDRQTLAIRDMKTGASVVATELEGRPWATATTPSGGLVLVGDARGNVYCFKPSGLAAGSAEASGRAG